MSRFIRAAAVMAIALIGCVALAPAAHAQLPVDTVRTPRDSSDSVAIIDAARLGVTAPVGTLSQVATDASPKRCGRDAADATLRRVGAGALFVGGNAGLFAYFQRAWWSGERSDGFFFRPDWDENFRDQDKFGHVFGGYHLARIGAALLRSACMSRGRSVAWSAAYAAAFQLQIEIFDGLYEKYGFSYPDLLSNTTGTALAALHETYPKTRAIRPTISYARSAALRNADSFEGELRPSLDYSGQTYWLSADVDAMLPPAAKQYWPGVLRVSAGHSITDWIDPRTGASLRARRRILLSIDFDAEKLPGENRIWKTIKRQIGYIHLPSPALQITPELEVIGWYR